jgi:hypothetical protein
MVTLDMIQGLEAESTEQRPDRSQSISVFKNQQETPNIDIFNTKDHIKKSTYRVSVLGGSCGKSCYVMRLAEGKFVEDPEPSVGKKYVCYLKFIL